MSKKRLTDEEEIERRENAVQALNKAQSSMLWHREGYMLVAICVYCQKEYRYTYAQANAAKVCCNFAESEEEREKREEKEYNRLQ